MRLIWAIVCVACGTGTAHAPDVGRPPLPTVLPAFVADRCPGHGAVAGCYDWQTGTIYDNGLSRYGRAHEVGHAFDASDLDDAERASFTERIRWTGHAWDTTYAPDGSQDVIGVDELFADAYASCRLGWMPRGRRGRYAWTHDQAYAYEPRSNGAQRRVCAAISRWAGRPDE